MRVKRQPFWYVLVSVKSFLFLLGVVLIFYNRSICAATVVYIPSDCSYRYKSKHRLFTQDDVMSSGIASGRGTLHIWTDCGKTGHPSVWNLQPFAVSGRQDCTHSRTLDLRFTVCHKLEPDTRPVFVESWYVWKKRCAKKKNGVKCQSWSAWEWFLMVKVKEFVQIWALLSTASDSLLQAGHSELD